MINAVLKDEGIKITSLVRLTFAPFGITSYIMGVSSISLSDYMLGNASYIINCCSQCFIGCSLFTAVQPGQDLKLSHDKNNLTRLTFIIEILLTVIVTVVIVFIARNILEKKLRE